jgi:DNA (cytosine-5)-methyltransferase 1
MRTAHLFAGAGGGLLADLILGHTPVLAVEWDAYCCAVLRERTQDGWFPGLHVHEGDVRLFDPSEWKGRVDCIHAGFPCTDISVSGPGGGVDGERSGLYREAIRIAGVIRPQFIFMENSPAIIGLGLGTVLSDLASIGYDTRWTCLSAAVVGAPIERNRWWSLSCTADKHVQDPPLVGAEASNGQSGGTTVLSTGEVCLAGWEAHQPSMVRMVDAMADYVDRIKGIGNGQVPLCAAAAWKILGGP